MPSRVVVTGRGVISALGHNCSDFWKALVEGRPGIGPLESVDRSLLRFQNGAEVRGYDPARYFAEKEIGLLDRFAQYGVIAAREAIAEAGIQWTDELRERTAIVTGSCVGGQTTEDEGFVNLYQKNIPRVNPLTIPRTMENAAASRISLETGIVGPTYTVSTACSSSNHAIGQAFWMVRSGAARLAIAGGSEAVFSLGFLKAWEAMRVVSPDTCRPFSRDRHGLILGDAGAMLVLETLEDARLRGARIYGEIVGFGMSSDAFHITQPSPDGAARAMRGALADAGISPDQISYINAHGTATQANDATETTAIRTVFGAARGSAGRQLHQIDARPHTRGGRRHRSGRHAAGSRGRAAAAHRKLQRARPGLRSGRCPECSAAGASGVRAFELVRVRRIERRAGFSRPRFLSNH